MLGSDYTLFSTVEGIVLYDKKKERPVVCASHVTQLRSQQEKLGHRAHPLHEKAALPAHTLCMRSASA